MFWDAETPGGWLFQDMNAQHKSAVLLGLASLVQPGPTPLSPRPADVAYASSTTLCGTRMTLLGIV